jgi:hypothetical protein
MNTIFQIVYFLLVWLSDLTGLSYRAVNIVVYFIIIPFVYLHLADKLIKKHYLKIGFSILVLILLLIIKDFEIFSSQLFDLSVKFLLWFQIIGWNYTVASVIICVIIPLIAFFVLFYFAYGKRMKLVLEKLYDRL